MKKRPPNIVIINPDQMRGDYASCYGHPFIGTQNIDRLAAMGSRFDEAFVSCPMCGPSRVSFLTGLYPMEHGVRDYGGNYDQARPSALRVLGDAGYVRGIWGKDHAFAGRTIGTLYDEGEDLCIGNMDRHPKYIHSYESAVLETDSEWNLTKRFTDSGLDFIERHAGGERPFFLTLNYQDPHPFFACPEPWASLFAPEQFDLPPNFRRGPVEGEIRRLTHWRIHSGETGMPEHDLKRAMAMYSGQIRYVDDQVGRVLDRLEALELLENTLVLFWSDHGEFLGDFGVTHKMPAFFECLMRVPLVLWDPTGKIRRGVHRSPVETIDAMATLLDLCGLPQPAGSRARSLVSSAPRQDVFAEAGLLCQQPTQPVEGLRLKAPFAPTSYGPGAMIRTDRWKLCEYANDLGELYDLASDPHETTNLYESPAHGATRAELQQRLIRRTLCRGGAPEDLPTGGL